MGRHCRVHHCCCQCRCWVGVEVAGVEEWKLVTWLEVDWQLTRCVRCAILRCDVICTGYSETSGGAEMGGRQDNMNVWQSRATVSPTVWRSTSHTWQFKHISSRITHTTHSHTGTELLSACLHQCPITHSRLPHVSVTPDRSRPAILPAYSTAHCTGTAPTAMCTHAATFNTGSNSRPFHH